MGFLEEFGVAFAPSRSGGGYAILGAQATDIGCYRAKNEDFVDHYIGGPDKRDFLAIVADGMGGHNGGEIASRGAVEVIHARYAARDADTDPLACLEDSLRDANHLLYVRSREEPGLSGMGTTVSALLIADGKAGFAHVGDSRIYLLRDGVMAQLTEDHTVVADLVRDGLLPPEAAATHPERNIITRAIGAYYTIDIETTRSLFEIRPGDCFVLCSDGLFDLIPDPEIKATIENDSPRQACERLIEVGREAGGYDNISVIVLKIEALDDSVACPP